MKVVAILLLLVPTACGQSKPQVHWWPRDATMTLHDYAGCDWIAQASGGITTITAQCSTEAGQRAMDIIAEQM
jgi:hypothetical protein